MQKSAPDIRFNHKRGVWEVRWSERQAGGVWRSRAISTGETTEAGARAFLSTWIATDRELDRQGSSLTLREVLDLYLAAHPEHKRPLWHAREALGDMSAEGLDPQAVLRWRLSRLAEVTEATTRRQLVALKGALRWAKEHALIQTVHNHRLPRHGERRELFLDEEQEGVFYAHAMGLSIGKRVLDPITIFVALALDTGARAGAIMELEAKRVSLDRGQIDFRVPGQRVTGKRRAVVPISKRLLPLITRALEETPRGLLVRASRQINARFRTFAGATPFPWVTPHVCRHTFATLNVRAGVPLEVVAELLADDPATVARVYRHHRPDWMRADIDRRWA